MSEQVAEQVAQPETAAEIQTPAEIASGGSGDGFLEMIPEDLREHPSLSPIKDVPNLVRSYVNAQRLIGADKVPLPENPSDEDLDRIADRLGRPETPQGYEIAVDGNIVTEKVATEFSDIAHQLRMTPKQVAGVLDYYRTTTDAAINENSQTFEQEKQQGEATLRQEWGMAYDEKVDRASNVAKQFAGAEVFDLPLSDGTRLGNHPEFIKAFDAIAEFQKKATSEDTVSENTSRNVMTPKDAQAEIDSILSNPDYQDRKNPQKRQRLVQRMTELMEMVHG